MTRPQTFAHDIRVAGRGLLRARAFTATAALTLTIGIAATTVMFALIQGVMLRPLPVRDQDRLVFAWKELRSSGFAHYPFGGADLQAVKDASHLIEAAAGVTYNGAIPWVAVEDGVATYVPGALVTGTFFEVLGVRPVLGRTLTASDDVDGSEPVVVISSGLWRERYGGSPDVLRRTVVLAGTPFAIVGVIPGDLDFPRGVQMWRTVRSVPRDAPLADAAREDLDLVARMRPGATIDEVRQELHALTRQLESRAPPDIPRGLIPIVRSFADGVVGEVRTAMLLMFAAVALVFLIAIANVANLLLMRNEARRRELAVRVALGAGRWRLASQVVGESAWLAGIAGLAGIAVATISLDALLSLIPDGLPRIEAVRVDASVVLFAGAVTFVAALLTGIWPAAFAHRVDLASQFRSREAGRRGVRGRSALVAAQVALAVVIVAFAGLLGRSLLNLRAADMGIAAERLVFVDLILPVAKIADRARHEQFLNALVERLDAEPLIEASTPIHVHPFSGTGGWDVPRFAAGGQSAERAATNPSLNLESVHPGYFHTFDIPILRGRAFTHADRKGATPVAIVSADVAERTWPGEDPIGKRLKMGGPDSADEWRTIVGVVQPNRYRELEKRRATLYLPAAQFLMMSRIVVLRTAAPLDMVASVVRARVPEVDPDAQVVRIAPFSEMLRQPLARPRFYAFIIGVFGIAALMLAIVGLYGVIAASVRQRDRELGIRVALGATARNVRALVLQDTLRLSIAGTLIGLAGAVAATRAVRSMLFEVDPLDPWTLLAAAIALIAASALAAYAPMRRAARADPAMMLRSE